MYIQEKTWLTGSGMGIVGSAVKCPDCVAEGRLLEEVAPIHYSDGPATQSKTQKSKENIYG
jgi:hypothetical protein